MRWLEKSEPEPCFAALEAWKKVGDICRLKGERMGSYLDRLQLGVRDLADFNIILPDNVVAMIMIDRADVDPIARRTLIQLAGWPMESSKVVTELRRSYYDSAGARRMANVAYDSSNSEVSEEGSELEALRARAEKTKRDKNKKKDRKTFRCFNCQEEGHFARDCPRKRDADLGIKDTKVDAPSVSNDGPDDGPSSKKTPADKKIPKKKKGNLADKWSFGSC